MSSWREYHREKRIIPTIPIPASGNTTSVLSGSGKFRDENNEIHAIAPGDHFQFATGQAHQVLNDGDSDLVFYVIANNTPVEICRYPDTGKTLILPDRELGYMQEAGYYAKEE